MAVDSSGDSSDMQLLECPDFFFNVYGFEIRNPWLIVFSILAGIIGYTCGYSIYKSKPKGMICFEEPSIEQHSRAEKWIFVFRSRPPLSRAKQKVILLIPYHSSCMEQ
jgi:hypothetical protein